MSFDFEPTSLEGVFHVRAKRHADSRGSFIEWYKLSEFDRVDLPHFVQDNESQSSRHTVRGLHYQRPPKAQAKLIRVTEGEIYDVAVDLRQDSPSFGKWEATRLRADDPLFIYVPAWCAHGFCVLSDTATVSYKTSHEYSPSHEQGVRWDDPALRIDWPTQEPNLSKRDRQWPPLQRSQSPF